MEARFTNGASVARAYAEGDHTELLAVFQYEQDAVAFGKSKIDEDAARDWQGAFYIVSNHYSACIKILRPKPKTKEV